MKAPCLVVLAALAAIAHGRSVHAQAQLVPLIGGTGADGVFAPSANTTLDSDQQCLWNFSVVRIPVGVTVRLVGSKPMYIRSQGDVNISGTIDASGRAGTPGGNGVAGGLGGAAGAGGGAGGVGGCSAAAPFNGNGTDGKPAASSLACTGGKAGKDGGMVAGPFQDPVGGGGGGGNAAAGMPGGPSNCCGPHAFSGAGGCATFAARGGGGGGGGGGDVDSATSAPANDGGGGGGGGGGWVTISTPTMLTVHAGGSIVADGGAGGASPGNGGAGGGGAGGGIDLIAALITNNGSLSAVGGALGAATQTNCGCSPGGAGTDGVVNAYTPVAVMGSGTSTPAVTKNDFSATINSCLGQLPIQITTQNPGDAYVTGVSLSTANLPTPWGTLLVAPDGLFSFTLGKNNVPPLFTALRGTGPMATIGVAWTGAIAALTAQDVKLYLQSVTLTSALTAITGLSNRVAALVKF